MSSTFKHTEAHNRGHPSVPSKPQGSDQLTLRARPVTGLPLQSAAIQQSAATALGTSFVILQGLEKYACCLHASMYICPADLEGC